MIKNPLVELQEVFSGSEIRLGLRLVRKQPLMAATVVLALGMGIALATTTFTFRHSVLHGHLPFAGGERFVKLQVSTDPEALRVPLDLARYDALRKMASQFSYLGGLDASDVNVLHEEGSVEKLRGARLTPGWFSYLPYRPLLGRILVEADGHRGALPVVLLSEGLWERRFGRDPDVVGRALNVGGVERQIVGVLPTDFEFPTTTDLWMPLDPLTLGGSATLRDPSVRVGGVLAPGAQLQTAERQVGVISRQIEAEDLSVERLRIRVLAFTDIGAQQIETAMSMLTLLAIMVLLVIASNVANLILARTSSRAPELALRNALGASRGRLVRQLFVEVLVLGTAAAVVGVAVSRVAVSLIEGGIADDMPPWINLSPSLGTLAFVVLATLLATAIGGVLPALRVTRSHLSRAISAGSGRTSGGGFGRIGGTMIVLEMALSVALLSVAAMLVHGMAQYSEGEVPLPDANILTAQVYVESPLMAGPPQETQSQRATLAARQEELLQAIAALPGVSAQGIATSLPRMTPRLEPVTIEAMAEGSGEKLVSTRSVAVSTGFLETLGGEATLGRLFVDRDFDSGSAPVAIVNEPFVEDFLQGRNPIGQRIRSALPGEAGEAPPWREIVGVVPDLGIVVGDQAQTAGFYVPSLGQNLFRVALRVEGDPLKWSEPLREAAFSVDPDIALSRIIVIDDVAMEDRRGLTTMGSVMAAVGGIAMLLSLVGMYAIVSFTVTRRTREIGIRVALGAGPRQIVRAISGRAGLLLLLGGLLGTAVGELFTGARTAILVAAIPDAGLVVYPSIFVLLIVSGLVATLVPIRRALAIKPSEALASS